MFESGLKSYFQNFWTKDVGLTYLLVFVCLGNFVVTPFLTDNYLLRILYMIFWMILLFAGIGIMLKNRRQKLILAIILAFFITVKVINIFTSSELAGFTGSFLLVAAYCILIWLILLKVFQKGPISIHRIVGAVVVYMLIANLWAELFNLVNDNIVGAFIMPLEENGLPSEASYLYFSFTTLTTTGYGDFLPVHPLARTLVIIEELIGVLYPVLLIGRLVSLKDTPS